MSAVSTTVPQLNSIEQQILQLLPRDIGSGRRWLTADDLAARIGLDRDRVRHYLVRMRSCYLIDSDGERPQGFARLARGDHASEVACRRITPGRNARSVRPLARGRARMLSLSLLRRCLEVRHRGLCDQRLLCSRQVTPKFIA